MRDVVIASYLRTAQSRARPNDPGRDWFHKLRADDLLAKLLPEVLKRAKVDKEEVDDFLVGCATGVSEQHTIGGRTPLLMANLSEKTPAKLSTEVAMRGRPVALSMASAPGCTMPWAPNSMSRLPLPGTAPTPMAVTTEIPSPASAEAMA